jgi:2-C-methyl-D-erythritol 4-phosphate cytidylyltransferase
VIEGLGLVIVAAGSSTRMRGIDKVWAPLDHRNVLWHSLNALGPIAQFSVVVVHNEQRERAYHELGGLERAPAIVTGGAQRQHSVARGLEALPPVTSVAVHDAARPFARPEILFRGIELLRECDGAIPGLAVTDTIKQTDEAARVLRTVDRANLRSVQTPQIFRREALVMAHASKHGLSGTVTDDAALLEACNFDVRVFPGQPDNFKITTEHDLRVARLLIQDRAAS